ncbi:MULTISPECIES: nitroreductase family protein [Vibrio]|uniref:nitroreductase family protein n=1 Tax=Vibrio TaxID=662 RepID=UPI0018810937|nr:MULTISPECIES: nitroreductase family protein [Vibrio]WVM81090.1 nitroreductase family protein [Vibrio harveyi]EGR1571581.1 hypothetical protein [Vibrio alginolyticus]EGX6961938.1 nitroreductase family protein [Vibrio alginolyticus]EJX2553842.1 nitroreductase family protein [Vibrio alginolyticus]ELA6661252.1 nitroreductase family protein [Vibrio alginolyticus]
MREILRAFKYTLKSIRVHTYDLILYVSSSNKYLNNDKLTYIYKLRKDFHKIEKGLTMIPRRPFFGFRVLDNIIDTIEKIDDRNHQDVISAVHVIEHYIREHNNDQKLIKYIDFVRKFNLGSQGDKGGYQEIKLEEICTSNSDFNIYKNVVLNRRTVRSFRKEKVSQIDVNEAVNIARHSPSACNRQSWRVKVIDRKEKIDEILKLQNGNDGFREQILNLAVITADLTSCISPEERKQVWFDSGLFSMNFVNSLHGLGIGSCFLNWCVDIKNDKKINSLLSLGKGEVVTVVIAFGYYDDSTLICTSPKKSNDQLVEFVCD